MDGKNRGWALEIGLYPGLLLGFRTYEVDENLETHVVYLPFVDLALTVEK